jgi:DNA-binding NarL/FixJ family response regulator
VSSLGEVAHVAEHAESETVAGRFTPRQMAILAPLRQGKSSGAVPCELNLSESTIKAHVGSLMQK